MDTVHPDEPACILPSARELLLNVEDRPVKPADADSPTDKMLIDEPYESAEPRPFLSPNRQGTVKRPSFIDITIIDTVMHVLNSDELLRFFYF